MGRDMVTAARLITCVGNDCQAVSQHSERTPESPHEVRHRAGREREEERRGRKEKERTKGGTSDAAQAPPLHRETPQARVLY